MKAAVGVGGGRVGPISSQGKGKYTAHWRRGCVVDGRRQGCRPIRREQCKVNCTGF